MGNTSEGVGDEATNKELSCNVDMLVISVIVGIGDIVIVEELIVSEGLIIEDVLNTDIIVESPNSMVDKSDTSEDKGTVKVELSVNVTLIMPPLPIGKDSSSIVVATGERLMSRLIVSDVML